MKRRYFQIIELMKKNPAITQRDIAGTLKISLAYVNQILFAMEQDGLLKTNGLPAIGKRVLTIKAHTEYDFFRSNSHGMQYTGNRTLYKGEETEAIPLHVTFSGYTAYFPVAALF